MKQSMIGRRGLFKAVVGVTTSPLASVAPGLSVTPSMTAPAAVSSVVPAMTIPADLDIFGWITSHRLSVLGGNCDENYHTKAEEARQLLSETDAGAEEGEEAYRYDIAYSQLSDTAISQLVDYHYFMLFPDEIFYHQTAYLRSDGCIEEWLGREDGKFPDIVLTGDDEILLAALKSRESLSADISKIYNELLELGPKLKQRCKEEVEDLGRFISINASPKNIKIYWGGRYASTPMDLNEKIEVKFFNKYGFRLGHYVIGNELNGLLGRIEKCEIGRRILHECWDTLSRVPYMIKQPFRPLSVEEQERFSTTEQIVMESLMLMRDGKGWRQFPISLFDREFLNPDGTLRISKWERFATRASETAGSMMNGIRAVFQRVAGSGLIMPSWLRPPSAALAEAPAIEAASDVILQVPAAPLPQGIPVSAPLPEHEPSRQPAL